MLQISLFLTSFALFIVIEGLPFLGQLSSLTDGVPGVKNLKAIQSKIPLDQLKKQIPIKELKKQIPMKDVKKMVPIKDPTKMLSKEAIDKTPLKAMGVNTKYLNKGGAAVTNMNAQLKKGLKDMDIGLDDDDDDDNKEDKKDDKDDDDDDDDD